MLNETLEAVNESKPEQLYVLGFLFNSVGEVALIEHQKTNRLNGLGGHVEPGEAFQRAMSREFLEESGALVADYEWNHFCTLLGPDYRVVCFRATADRELRTQNEGLVRWYKISELSVGYPLMENLLWLIGMSQDKSVAAASVALF